MSDNIKQVGKYIKDTRKATNTSLNRYSETFPKIERVRGYVSTTQPFIMEFRNTASKNRFLLTISFMEAFSVTGTPGPAGSIGPSGPSGPTGASGSGVVVDSAFPVSPTAGNLCFRTDAGKEFYYTGTTWRLVPLGGHITDTLSGDVNNYTIAGGTSVNIWRIDPGGASRNITGIVAPAIAGATMDGYRLIIINTADAAENLVLKNVSGSSTLGNRLYCPGNADFTITRYSATEIVYSGTGWHVLAT